MRFLASLALVAVGAFIGEDSCIRLYGFYAYASTWHAFIDKVPLAIVCIWPVVVVSALDLAHALAPQVSSTKRALLASLVVLADASLIEPIATASGLWSWSEPGPFHVPLIGVLGWSCFALGAAWMLELRRAPLVVVVGPLTAHALLLALWWLAFRWLPRGADASFVLVALAWTLSLALTVVIVRKKIRIARADLLLRVPAAFFFFVLLAIYARRDVALVAYALAFAPPYLALTRFSARAAPPPR
ncbi:MAG TPA: carotenoid biosynthesis protein [Myxococcota bacterium]